MAKKCASPKAVAVKSYARAKRKKKAAGPVSYYVAENEHGHTCGHKHRTRQSAHTCAVSTERHYRAKYGRKSTMAGSYLVEKKLRE
jgi:hypothetical protein